MCSIDPELQERMFTQGREDSMVGVTLGSYLLEDKLGSGAFSSVYRARHVYLEEIRAVKVMTPVLADSERAKQRFLREAKIAFHLDHPNIVTVHDFGVEGDIHYIVMAFIPSQTLAEHLKHGRVSTTFICDLISQVAGAIDYAHQQGIVHRDIKPANILLHDRDQRAMLADFGIARLGTESTLTQADATIGTYGYMSPEQCEGGRLDGRSDIYALSVVIYEMLTGRPPFGHGISAISGHLKRPAPSLLEERPDLPVSIAEVLGRGLAKDPRDRFDTATDLALALRGVIGDAAIAATPTLAGATHAELVPPPVPLVPGALLPVAPASAGSLKPKPKKRPKAKFKPVPVLMPVREPVSVTDAAVDELPATTMTPLSLARRATVPAEESRSPRRRWMIPVAAVAAVLVAVAAIAVAATQLGPGQPPAGASSRLLDEAITHYLKGCAAATSVASANCPIGYNESLPLDAGPVQRRLVAGPLPGASNSYAGRNNFHMNGRAIILIEFLRARVPVAGTAAFAYDATVHWNGSSAAVSTIRIALNAPPVARKVDDAAVKAAALEGLGACANVTVPHDPACPQPALPEGATDIHWKLDGVPTVSRVSYDPANGIYTTRGTYAMTETHGAGAQLTVERTNGPYVATLAWSGVGLAVIRVAG